MKLVIAVVQGTDADRLLRALNERGFAATQIVSAGGFLRESNVTLFVGVDDEKVADVASIVKANSVSRRKFVNPLMPFAQPVEIGGGHTMEIVVGGATIFVIRVAEFVRLPREDAHVTTGE